MKSTVNPYQLLAESFENNVQDSYLDANYIMSSKSGSAVFHNIVRKILNDDPSVF
jgi:hypothetical protein